MLENSAAEPKMLNILTWPNDEERLRVVSQEVTDFDEELKQLIVDMFYTMHTNNGIGIAAPQVGVAKRLIVMMLEQPVILVNPVIIASEGEQTFEEGCLSLPGYFANNKRAEKIRIAYQNEDGVQMELSATGVTAVCIQHEIDHLDGKLFIDNLSVLKKMRAKSKIQKTLRAAEKQLKS